MFNKTFKALMLTGTIVFTTGANASLEFAKSKNCLQCHAENKKLVGPSFADIKGKYENDPKAVEKLSQKVIKGGSGVWGAIPMPANNQVSQKEAEELITWIMKK